MDTETKEGNSLVLVDLTELGKGLETAFKGIAMVFGSLGKEEAEIPAALPGVEIPTAIGKAADAPADKPASEAADKPPGKPKQETDSVPQPVTPTSVTLDDITKVIVAKIKQKRGNNAKIGSLLKAYGADKVSSLPEEKYEAFLTDISQL